jgi:hypothetical protein
MAAPPRSLVENFPNKFIAKYGLEVGFFYVSSVVSCEQTVGADVTAAVTLPPMAVVINRWSVVVGPKGPLSRIFFPPMLDVTAPLYDNWM